MKRMFLKNMLLLLPVFTFAENEKIIRNSTVTEVKVFLSGASVTRKLSVPVEPGITKLIIEELSSRVNANSINVSGTGNLTILSVQYEVNYLNAEKKTPEIIRMEDSLEILNSRIEQLTNARTVYQEEQSMILANKTIGGANTGVKTDDLIRMADFYRNRLTDIKGKLSELNQREKKLREQADKWSKQLALLNAKKNQPTGNIVITVSSRENANADLMFTYSVNDAGWIPFYDLRAENTSSPLKIVYRSNVYQATGEDWKGVKLILSTGNPGLSGTKPELTAWYLNYVQNYYGYGNKKLRAQVLGDAPATVAMDRNKEENTERDKANEAKVTQTADYTIVNDRNINAEFIISIPYTIPSDGKQYAVEIQDYHLNGIYNYAAIPKLDKDAFLNSNITGWESLDLLPGEANIYFEGGYVGKTYLDPAGAEDTLKVSLGREKRIFVKREMLKEITGNQFLGGSKIKTVAYEITVKNTRKEKINLTLEDQIPVSQQKDIEVEALEINGAQINHDTGKLSWNLTLEPNETIKKKFSFAVKSPKDKVISGI